MTKAYGVASFVKALIIAYVVTGIMLFVLAFLMYKFGISEQAVNFGVTFIYILATGVAGILMGRSMKQRKFLWGSLVGLIYVALIFVVSLLVTGNATMIMQDGVSTLLLCVGGGMLGGMLS